ncbi:retinoblastoma-like protein 1 isoform X1 [Copidosoma floridanum]|uniref:retinoblastoma-like protein 1 isoform X1 n=1 Tax=Copidosoma floridanum TaxID=29053 RepID=UPI0006C943E4|nr:retinoblastoma-like protein 1 isoform X1 [Copidosoma floridanum]XP_014208876.1 retinoblastoma-like protein 1 isoform X1 [Copidosoma floridanum]
MGRSDDIEDSTFVKHQDLCQKLNMDASAANEAWTSYENIRQHYTLEGDQLHWIGCALYVACRKATTPTVGKTGTNIQGNCVSFTRLLRLCNLPLIEFFDKSKAWADMCNMPKDFGARIDTLQSNFAVSSVIFQKYQPIFKDIFKNPAEDLGRPVRVRRHKAVPCTPTRLFEFCWSLFICIKSGISTISDDLVNSYHLLIVCCDLMYSNALLSNRKDLLNPEFPGLPENFKDDNFTPPETANCIVNLLCDRHKAIAVEAMSIKEYSLKRYVNKLFNEKVIRGDQSTFSGILEPLNFDGNNKAVNKAYEQHVLSHGDLDERIFLAEWRRIRLDGVSRAPLNDEEIAWCITKGPDSIHSIGSSPSKMLNIHDLQEQFQSKKEQLATMQHLAPPTPLTGRKYLKTKDVSNAAPTSNPAQSVIRLQSLLVGCQAAPSDALLEIFNNSSSDTQAFVESKVKELGKLFCDAYSPKVVDQLDNSIDFGKKRLQSSQTLFYKVLEMVLNDEKAKKPNFDVATLLKNEVFLKCMFACCCEIIVYSYQNKDRTFPWILGALNLEAYCFYKVIEVIVKVAVDQLTRDMVKHLNRIEEMILESLAWKSGGPLWQALESCEGGVPSFEDVALPGTFDLVDPNTPGQPVLRRIALDRGAHHSDVTQSPISSASERFQSPVPVSGLVKKRLFADPKPTTQSVLKAGGNPSLISRLNLNSEQKNSGGPVSSTPIATINRDQSKPRRTGSLALFFRKFYNLTITRMQTICNALNITETDLKKKIWTIFEYSIMERTHLMKDRHLDQILMSAVYVICKLGKIEKNTFTEIMRCYRMQPQAESHIYRSVLISRVSNNAEAMAENVTRNNALSNLTPPSPSEMAATSRIYGSDERGDLIKFYNTIYVPEVKDFAKKLGLAEGNISNLTLSPLPKGRTIINSSPVRRVTESVMTRVLDPKEIMASPAPQLQYCFSRSPAKDLESINKMVTSVDARKCVGKRLLSDDSSTLQVEDEPNSKKIVTSQTLISKKLENVLGDRRTQNQ